MAALGEQYRLLVLYPYRDYVEEGGVHQILNGTKAGDIPFYQPSKFQLIINAEAARVHNLPPTLVARADEVIE